MKKKFLAAFLAVCMLVTMLVIPANAASKFEDTEGHWAAEAIDRWAGYGVINGTNEAQTTYEPDRTMTRAEFAKFIVSVMGYDVPADPNPFTDIDSNWGKDFILKANKAGVVNGTSTDKFSPQNPVTGEQIALILCRATGLVESNNPQDAVTKLTDMGLIDPEDKNITVGSKEEANRALVAAMTSSLISEYVPAGTEKTISESTKGVVVVAGGKVTIEGDVEIPGLVVSSKGEAAADESTKIGSVVLTGTEPAADLKGGVESITVSEGATGVKAEAPKFEGEVVNKSAEDATINGETVAGTPETPADNTGDNTGDTTDETTGVSGGPVATHTHTWVFVAQENWPEGMSAGANQHIAKCTYVDANGHACGEYQVQNCSYKATYDSSKVAAGHYMACTLAGCTHKQTNPNPIKGAGDDKLFAHTGNGRIACSCGYKETVKGGENDCGKEHVWATQGNPGYTATTPTCTADGKIVMRCTNMCEDGETQCSATKEVFNGAKVAHHFMTAAEAKQVGSVTGNVTAYTAPTCSAAGAATVKCDVGGEGCKETKDLVLEKLPHTFNDANKVVESGEGHAKYCSVCNVKTALETNEDGTVKVAAHDTIAPENYSTLVSAATCEKKAVYSAKCKCGKVLTMEKGDLAQHVFEQTNDGKYYCINCKKTFDTMDGGRLPTTCSCNDVCENWDWANDRCGCGAEQGCDCTKPASKPEPCTGDHTEGKLVGRKAATCGEAGYEDYICSACGTTWRKTLPATEEHTFGTARGTLVTAGNCTTKAVYKVKCDNCTADSPNKTVEGEVDATKHDFSGDATWDATQHWKVCSRNESHLGTKENHSWTGDDTNGWTCSGCDATKATASGTVTLPTP